MILLFSTPRGPEVGFPDRWTSEGVFEYYGEGQCGDMAMERGNKAIKDHAEQGQEKDLHLFEGLGGGLVEYIGHMKCKGHEVRVAPGGDRIPRRAIVFKLERI